MDEEQRFKHLGNYPLQMNMFNKMMPVQPFQLMNFN
jgi:hypothetical protein